MILKKIVFLLKSFLNFSFKMDNIYLDPDPKFGPKFRIRIQIQSIRIHKTTSNSGRKKAIIRRVSGCSVRLSGIMVATNHLKEKISYLNPDPHYGGDHLDPVGKKAEMLPKKG